MIWFYRLLFPPVLLVLAPRYLWRMRRRGGYWRSFRHRFGAYERPPRRRPGVPRVWLQAVSVGEMLAIGPILEALRRDGTEVFLTTTTSTGYRVAADRYAGLVVGLGYFPIDWWPFSRRAWKRVEPDLAVLTEGERWPEHLHQARKRGVPALGINGRISERSFRRLRRFPFAARFLFRDLDRVLPCSADDERRFRALGVPAELMRVTGNIKLDVAIPPIGEAGAARLRRELGLPPGGFVLLGSSTWPGEEKALLEVLAGSRAAGLRGSLLLVPRHAERRGEIEKALRATAWRWHFRSRGGAPAEVDVAVADTTGELGALIQLADLVFVGKSLPPHTEGQTPVEAAALGKPILFGPGMSNFRAVARDLLARGAALEVPDGAALADEALALWRDAPRRDRLAAAAAAWRRDNAGAGERTLEEIRAALRR